MLPRFQLVESFFFQLNKQTHAAVTLDQSQLSGNAFLTTTLSVAAKPGGGRGFDASGTTTPGGGKFPLATAPSIISGTTPPPKKKPLRQDVELRVGSTVCLE